MIFMHQKEAVHWFTSKFKKANIKRVQLISSDYNSKNIGHFGIFKEKFSDTLWPSILEFIEYLKRGIMLTKILQKIIIRDLEKLKVEISLYKNQKNLWRTNFTVSNSAGNLCLHIIGNLNTYIGLAIGNTGYVRNRELEFSDKNLPVQYLFDQIEKNITMVNKTFANLTDADLQLEYPTEVSAGKTTTAYYLTHITAHLSYHLGQINYHRRIFETLNYNLPFDVLKQIEIQFSENKITAKDMIYDYYAELINEYKNHDQIIRAIIYLSNSNLLLLNENIIKAKSDWRDILVRAEYNLDESKSRNFCEPFDN